MKSYKKIFTWVAIDVFAVSLLTYFIIPQLPSEVIRDLGEAAKAILATIGILGVIPILVSLIDLHEERKRNANESVLGVLNFFREEIIPLNQKVFDSVKDENVKMINLGSLSGGTTFSLKDITSLSDKEIETFGKKFKEYNEDIFKNMKLQRIIIDMLNMLEELSAKILLPENSEHEAYKAIHYPFIEVVETNAIMLYVLKNFYQRNFPHVVRLYQVWKPLAPRALMTEEDRINLNKEEIDKLLGRTPKK